MARAAKNPRSKATAEPVPPGWGRSFLKGVAAVAALILFSVVVIFAYNKGKEAGGGSTPPGRERIRLSRRGGLDSPGSSGRNPGVSCVSSSSGPERSVRTSRSG